MCKNTVKSLENLSELFSTQQHPFTMLIDDP